MKIIENEIRELLFYNDFFDEDYELLTPNSRERYQLGLYDHFLNKKEVIENLENQNDSQWFRKAEANFLSFFEEVLTTESHVEFSASIISNIDFATSINTIDYEDKEAYIEFIKCYKECDATIFKVEKLNDVRLFTKFLTREMHHPTFHFEEGQVNLLSNFDLFYPIFFKNKKLVEKYCEIAKKHNLFVLKV